MENRHTKREMTVGNDLGVFRTLDFPPTSNARKGLETPNGWSNLFGGAQTSEAEAFLEVYNSRLPLIFCEQMG